MQTKLTTRSPDETREFGARLARELVEAVGSAVVALTGELGSGKTTFVRGAAEGLGVDPGPDEEGETEGVTSPTFVLVREHEGRDGRRLVHVDACRLRSAEELREVGSDDFLPPRPSTGSTAPTGPGGVAAPRGVAFVEWAEKVEEALPRPYLWLSFRHVSEEEREIAVEVRGVGEGAELLVQAAARALASDGTCGGSEAN